MDFYIKCGFSTKILIESIDAFDAGPKEGDYLGDLEYLAVNELALDVRALDLTHILLEFC